jgi:beta-mannosidase
VARPHRAPFRAHPPRRLRWRIPVKLEYFVPADRRSIDRNSETATVGDGKSATVDFIGELLAPDGSVAASGRLSGLVVNPGANVLELELSVIEPRLWWPAGYGDQPLYTLVAAVTGADGTAARTSKRLGFRELRVVADEDSVGRSLTIRVNGKDIWAKGANWIPFDALPARQTPGRYRELLSDMVAANITWSASGAGLVRASLLRRLRRLGILVWQI